jgi:hypothetical protein
MELEKIIEILEKHQEWRRDQNVPPKTEMQSPIEIGTAIDYALSELKKIRLGSVSQERELLLAYEEYTSYKVLGKKTDRISKQMVEDFLANNCG